MRNARNPHLLSITSQLLRYVCLVFPTVVQNSPKNLFCAERDLDFNQKGSKLLSEIRKSAQFRMNFTEIESMNPIFPFERSKCVSFDRLARIRRRDGELLEGMR